MTLLSCHRIGSNVLQDSILSYNRTSCHVLTLCKPLARHLYCIGIRRFTMTIARSIAQVNKAIHARISPLVSLVKGNGYFYVVSDDDDMSLRLASLDSTSIYICHLNQAPVARWVAEVKWIYEDAMKADVTPVSNILRGAMPYSKK